MSYIMCHVRYKGGVDVTNMQLNDALQEQQEIADILSYLKSKGYEFSEREKGRIEQMLLDGKVNAKINPSTVT